LPPAGLAESVQLYTTVRVQKLSFRNPYTIRSALLFLARLHGPPNADTGTGREQKMDHQPCLKQAQWTFYPSKAYWLLDARTGLTCKNFTFCPNSVLMCFVFISEKIAAFAPYSTN
jgi:hypothetical protein